MSRSGPLDQVENVQSIEQAEEDHQETDNANVTAQAEKQDDTREITEITPDSATLTIGSEEPIHTNVAAEEPPSLEKPDAIEEEAPLAESETEAVSSAIEESVAAEPEAAPAAEPATEPTEPAPEEESQPTADRVVSSAVPRSSRFVPPIKLWPARLRNATKQRGISLALLLLLLFGIAAPLVVVAGYGISAYATYNALRTHADSGLHHLLAVKTIFGSASVQSSSVLDAKKLELARGELEAAQTEFVQTRSLLDNSSILPTLMQYLPQYRPQIVTAHAASQIGIDIAAIGQQLITVAQSLAPRLHNPLLITAQTPLVTHDDLTMIGTTLDTILPYVNDIQSQVHLLSIDALPLDAHQRTQVRQYIQMLPQLKDVLVQGHSFVDALGWLLGVDQPRTFLVQTMDSSELRATGGFTGQYGELQISNGRIAPFSLHDISFVEYTDNSPTFGQQAPQAYRSWWPFANWGLRDSNLSADFPTSAQLAIQQYKSEVHRDVDGVILFTPLLIERVLQVTGPIQIPQYNETITADNLEARVHYYQLDNAGIRKEELIEHVEDPAQARKLFASAVARTLMEHVRHASPDELLALGQQMLQDLTTRDLQIYFTNPQIETLLQQKGYAAQMDRSTTHDGLYVVQTNVSASKASIYVHTTIHDSVSLDANGGATHTMQLRFVYNQLGPVYGLDTYRDYLRVYVPPTAKFLGGNGFDTGKPLCGGPFGACPADGIYPGGELVCPPGGYDAGASAPMLDDPYQGAFHPLDEIGPPTNLVSDEPGRAMFGGYIVIPKNCTMTATLSWYVPPMSHDPYSLFVQHQAGTFPELDLTVLPTPGNCAALATSGLYFDGILTRDTSFIPHRNTTKANVATNCYPQPAI
ncbi:MAG TPA: DUF4012 domain-containing protein [Ktedonobacteraceae bacterium]|nr:DUF4012 domain-containing protein [Ktedonobacteraceae bacterium]